MAKRPTLEPRKTTKPYAPWCVNLPPSLSSTGKRERRYFDTKKEAETFCAQQRIRFENYGTASTLLPPGKVEEASLAYEKLEGSGASLIEAVEFFLSRKREAEKSITFQELFVKFQAKLRSKKRRGRAISETYKRQVRNTPGRFPGLSEKLVCDVNRADLLGEIHDAPAASRNALLRVVKAAFNYAIEEGWAKSNPVFRGMMEDTGHKRVEVFSNLQVSKLLVACLRIHPELLPYHLLGLFAGIRPDELLRIEWKHIQFPEKVINLPAEITKTGFERWVQIEPNLLGWLEWFRQQHGNLSGPIAPRTNLRRHLREVRKKARIKKWIQDGMRHTYASNWMAVHKDEDRCRDNMGHRTKDELQKHYRKHLPLKQALRFWGIHPPKRKPGNVVWYRREECTA